MTDAHMVMPNYEQYKSTGFEWLPKVPKNWKIIKLRFMGRFSSSGIDKLSKKNESVVKIINFTDIFGNKNGVIDSSEDFMVVTTPENNRVKNLVEKGDLIFLPSSETYEDLGLAALINEDLENTSFSYHVIRYKFSYDIDHSFKKYITNNKFVQSQFSKFGKGTTRKIIGRGIFNDIVVVVPPLVEQTLIGNFLNLKTAKIDQAIAIKEKQITLLKERKQTLIQNAVTRGLDPNVPMKDSGVEWIGLVPMHWEVIKIKYLFKETNQRTKTGQETLLSLRMELGLVPHDDVSEKYIPNENLVDYKMVTPGQLVMNRMRAAIGIFGIPKQEGLVSPDYAVFNIADKVNLAFYLKLFKTNIMGSQFRLNSRGLGTGSSGFMRLYTENFGDIKVPFPAENEQAAVVTHIEKESAKIDQAADLQQKQIEKLKEYKSTLINSAVTGKIKVA